MKRTVLAMAIASTTAMATQAGTVTTDGPDIVLKTKGGVELKTADGNASFKLAGRIQLDYNDFDGVINSVPGKDGSDVFFRRARIELGGHYYDWGYYMSYNLTQSGSIDQMHTTYQGFGPLAQLTFGQQKENFGLDDTGSSKWITAIERSMPANAFDTGNNIGVKLHGANDLVTYSAGVYRQGIDQDNDLDAAYTGRVVVRPMYESDSLVHIGAGYTTRDGDFTDFNSRLGVRGGESGSSAGRVRTRYTGGAIGDEFEAWNLELAASFGPFHAMAEYFDGEISGDGGVEDIQADGYYVQAGWILTGESRRYKTDIAAFDSIKPSNASGAWEIFARYDELDLSGHSHPLIQEIGGKANTWTLGVNWYANELVKIGVNYVRADTDKKIGGEDDGDAIVGRIQFAF